jgi:uncharacterized protein (DUF1501 family)
MEVLARLADGLETEALLDRTIVLVISEMGRTPVRNATGGKDHWPVTSALVFGGPVRGDRVIGGTTDALAPVGVNPTTGDLDPGASSLRPASLLAGVLACAGLDPEEWYPGVTPLELGAG